MYYRKEMQEMPTVQEFNGNVNIFRNTFKDDDLEMR